MEEILSERLKMAWTEKINLNRSKQNRVGSFISVFQSLNWTYRHHKNVDIIKRHVGPVFT